MIFWDEERQKIKFLSSNSFTDISNYCFIGYANDTEFDIILQVLFDRYGEDHISTEEILKVYNRFMMFLGRLKKITNAI